MKNCYSAPTADIAIANVDRERRREERRRRLLLQRENEEYLRALEHEANQPRPNTDMHIYRNAFITVTH